MRFSIVLFVIAVLASCACVDAANAKKRLKVLVFSNSMAYSHAAFNIRLGEVLKEAGHEVHLLLPLMNPAMPFHGHDKVHKVYRTAMNNSEEILSVLASCPIVTNQFGGIQNMMMDGFQECYRQVDNLELYDLIHNDDLMTTLRSEKFDIGVTEALSTHPLSLFYAIGIRTTFMTSPLPTVFYHKTALGIPPPSSFVQDPIATISVNGDQMTIWERVQNMFFSYYLDYFHYRWRLEQQQILNDKFGPNFPDLRAINNNVSYVFENTHPLLDLPQITTPKVVYVGGIVKSVKKPLSKEILAIFEKPSKGVVFFSIGTLINEIQMPLYMKRAIVDAFGELTGYEFIVKYNTETGPLLANSLPTNVHLFKWVDQAAILAHSRLKVFVTHCGLNSMNEAARNGVPLVTIPLFGDQLYNAAVVKSKDTGVYIDVRHLSKESLVEALRAVIEEPRYRENAEVLKKKLETYPHDPVDLFLKHVEFAAQFGPLRELSLAGAEMSFYNYYNLDVVALFFVILALGLFAVHWTTSVFLSFVKRRHKLD